MKYRFFDVARKISKKSDYHPHPIGAVITKGNVIMGLGYNKRKTHPRSNNKFKTTHAELSAILNAGIEDLSGCDIYIYRETKANVKGMSYPCQYCEQLLKDVGINKIHYTIDSDIRTKKL